MRPGRFMFPAFPHPRLLPWILAAASAAALAFGIITNHEEVTVLGVAGLAMLIIAYPLARLIVGSDDEPQDQSKL